MIKEDIAFHIVLLFIFFNKINNKTININKNSNNILEVVSFIAENPNIPKRATNNTEKQI